MTIICDLCAEVATNQKATAEGWEVNYSQTCFESVSQLLGVDGLGPSAFLGMDYCYKCTQFLRDVDVNVRTLTSLQTWLSKARIQMAKLLVTRLEVDPGHFGDIKQPTNLYMLTAPPMKIESNDAVSEGVNSFSGSLSSETALPLHNINPFDEKGNSFCFIPPN